MSLRLVHLELAEANDFVDRLHRHHKPVVGHKFSLGALSQVAPSSWILVGVAIVGRPVARHRDDGDTLEVTRLCTDGTPNACSFLYGAAARATFALGFHRVGTYILREESGVSLVAAGWRQIGSTPERSWSRPKRLRKDSTPPSQRTLFERRTA